MSHRICPHDQVEVPENAFVLDDGIRRTYFCELRCLTNWSIQISLEPNLTEGYKNGPFVIETPAREERRFAGIAAVAHWAAEQERSSIRNFCSYDRLAVPGNGFVLDHDGEELYFCKLRCLCLWSVQVATRPTLSEADRRGTFLLHSLTQKELRFEGIVELARWSASSALGKAATPMEKGKPAPRLLDRNSPGKKLPQAVQRSAMDRKRR